MTVAELTTQPDRLAEAVAATGAQVVYIHIDLDVLDPQAFRSLNRPEPGALSLDTLRTAVRSLTDRFTLAGLGITEYTPQEPGDQHTLQALVPALLTPAEAQG